MLVYAVRTAPALTSAAPSRTARLRGRLASRHPRRQQAAHLHSGQHPARDGPRYFAW